MKKKIIFLVAAALMLNSCDDLFEPAIENFKDVETDVRRCSICTRLPGECVPLRSGIL